MGKRKVQVVIFYCAKDYKKHFLLLKVNKERGLFWQNVTGGVNKNEKYTAGALREVIEETGLKKKNIKELIKTDMKFKFLSRWGKEVKEKVFLLQCHKPWDVVIDPKEHCKYKWVEESEISAKSVKFETNYQALQLAMEASC